MMRSQWLKMASGPVLALLIVILIWQQVPNQKTAFMAGIAVWMAVWWIFEALPLAVTALLPIVLYPTFGIMGTKDIAPSYMNDIIFLFIGGFLLAFAIEQWQLHKRIASRIMNLTGQSPARIILGIMLTTFLLSMWISNTATTIMMIAPATAIIASLDLGKNDVGKRKFAIALLLGIAYSASLGGMATLIGTPPNLIFAKQYEIAFPDAAPISFSQWFIFAFPVSLIFLFIVYQLLHFRYFRRLPSARLNSSNLSALKTIKASYEEKVVLIAFVLLAILFFFRADILIGNFRIPGWSSLFANPGFFKDGTIAIAVALILFIIPSKSEKQTHILSWRQGSRIPFNIILLIGGGFALAKCFSDTGLSVCVGNQVQGLHVLPLLFFIAFITLMMTFLTEVTSNTATTQIILPVLAAIAIGTGIQALYLMIPATLSASCAFMLPVATPPNAIIFGTKHVTMKEMVRTGLWLNLIGVGLISLTMYFFGSLVFAL